MQTQHTPQFCPGTQSQARKLVTSMFSKSSELRPGDILNWGL